MVTADFARLIKEQVCSEIRVAPVASNRFSIGLPLSFGDGDACRIMVTAGANGHFLLSDGGFVRASGMMDGVDLLGPGRAERFRVVADFYGVKERSGELRMQATTDDLGDAVFVFTQACIELARLSELPRESSRRTRAFTVKFRKVVEKSLDDERLEKHWHDPKRDPQGIYVADYRFAEDGLDWLIFGAGSAAKCWKASSTVQHYKFKELQFKTVFAYSKSAAKRGDAFAVMADNADYKFSIESERRDLRQFLRGL